MNQPFQFSRRHWAGAVGLFVATGLLLVFLLNPAEHAFYPQCVFHSVTGWNCPGCGGLRAIHQLLHGHVVTAFQLNPLFISAIPVVMIFFLRGLLKKPPEKRFSFQPMWLWIGLVVVIAFGIARNLPFPPFGWMTQLPQ